jgi:hypothetical protein
MAALLRHREQRLHEVEPDHLPFGSAGESCAEGGPALRISMFVDQHRVELKLRSTGERRLVPIRSTLLLSRPLSRIRVILSRY